MALAHNSRRVFLCSLVAFWASLLDPTVEAQVFPSTSDAIRVGIVAYQDFQKKRDQYDKLFNKELFADSDPTIRFKLDAGTYGDVLHWIDQDWVDVALLTPGVYSAILRGGASKMEYLVAIGLKPIEKSSDLSYRYQYQSACIVAKNSSIKTVQDLKSAVQGGAKLLFVHPLSVSGRIAPEFALKRAGIDLAKAQIIYTYSHNNSIRMVEGTGADEEVIAFVWDDVPENRKVRKLEFPELKALSIPYDVVSCSDLGT